MSGTTDVPLGPAGLREAARLAECLATERPYHRIYTSPLSRALETAKVIARRCGLALSLDQSLREIHCGAADGLRLSEVEHRYPELWLRNLEQSDPDFRWPEGESYREFRERILQGLDRIVQRHRGERLLVVTHSGVVSQVVGWVFGASPGCWGKYRPRTGSLTELWWTEAGVSVVRYDELPGEFFRDASVGHDE